MSFNFSTILQILTNVSIVALFLLVLFYIMLLYFEKRKQKYMLNMQKKNNFAKKITEQIKGTKVFYNELDAFMKERDKEHLSDIFFYAIIGFLLLIVVAMLYTGQFILAIVYPIIVIWFIRRMFKVAKKDPVIQMEEELPVVIDHMIRIFTKYSDVKNVIYETSVVANGLLKEELKLLSRRMNTQNPSVVLEEFSEKYPSVWLNNFAFILLGYLQDSSKDEMIQNLRHLRSLLDQENTTKKEAISQRKPSLFLNYALAVIGGVGCVLTILFNPIGFNFFFHSYLGLICFTAGCGCIMATIYLNIKMMKIEK